MASSAAGIAGQWSKARAAYGISRPGTFPTTESVTLVDADTEAVIHYTWDGSAPNSKSPVYDPCQLLLSAASMTEVMG